MELRPLGIDGVIEIIPKKFGDARGYFSETYARAGFRAAGIAPDWVQDNQSFSAEMMHDTHLPNVAELLRRSTATSKIAPLRTRINLS